MIRLRLRLELDDETSYRLIVSAVSNLRPVNMEAERLLRESLGLPVPWPATEDRESREVSHGER